MILYLDIGNTCVKWRFQNSHGQEGNDRVENQKISASWVEALLKKSNAQQVIVSNVSNDSISSLFRDAANKQCVDFITISASREMAGLRFAYEDIASLGVDRCLAMIGAFQEKAVLVIDAGSAITADYINANGEHIGGFILPGCRMLQSALNTGTSRIDVDPLLGFDEPGVTTKACVSNGLTLLMHSMLGGLVSKANTLGIYEYVITGGDAEYLAKVSLDVKFGRKENLVLDGMQYLHKIGWFGVNE
jgi:type III pantothenate kinase